MSDLLQKVATKFVKPRFTDVHAGDTVRVYTTVKEGNKTRTQFFEGLVIRRRGGVGPNASFTVRRIASGVGVERTFPLHSPVITEVKVIRGAKVRRVQLHYMRERAGKSARLREQPVKQADRERQHPWVGGTVKAAPKASPKPASKPEPKPTKANAKPADQPTETKKAEAK